MASRVDSSSADDLTVAYRRLSAAYQQTLRYAEDVRRLYQQVQRAIYQSLLGLANALEAKDPYTRGHSERVGAWSRSVAAALGLPPSDVDMIGQAGLLHDIGKIGIPETVLRKTGELDPVPDRAAYRDETLPLRDDRRATTEDEPEPAAPQPAKVLPPPPRWEDPSKRE